MPTLVVAINASRAKSGAAQASAAMNQVRHAARGAAGSQGLAQLSRQMGLTSSATFVLRRHLFGLTAAITAVAGVRAAVQTLGSFERSLATIRVITRSTAEEMRGLEEVIRNAGVNSQYGADLIAKGAVELARAGAGARESMTLLPAAIDLATAAETDMAETTKTLLAVMQQFHASFEEAARVADTLTKASNDSITEIEDIMIALRYVGPLAYNTGLSLEETAAALEILADSGIRASMAGTALRGILVALSSPTEKAVEQLETLGMEMSELNPEAHGLVEVINNLASAQLRTSEAGVIFTRRVASGALSLSQFKDNLHAFIEANKNAQGETRLLAGAIEDTLSVSLARFGNAFKEAFLRLKDIGVSGSFKTFVDNVNTAILILVDSSYRLREASEGGRTYADIIAGVGGAISAFVALRGAIIAARIAWAAFHSLMAATPLGLLVLAISAAVGALLYFRDKVLEVGDRSFRVIDLIVATFEHFRDAAGFILRTIANLWEYVWKQMPVVVQATLQGIIPMFRLTDENWRILLTAMLDVAKQIANAILLVFAKLVQSIETLFNQVMGRVTKIADALQAIVADPSNLDNYLRAGQALAESFVMGGVDAASALGDIWLTGWDKNLIDPLLGAISTAAPGFKTEMEKALGEGFFEEFDKYFNPERAVDAIFDRADARYKERQAQLAARGLIPGADAGPPAFPGSTRQVSDRPFLTSRARDQIIDFKELVQTQMDLLAVSRSLNAEQERGNLIAKAREMQAKSEGAITDEYIANLELIIQLRQEMEAQFQVEETINALREERDLFRASADEAERLNYILGLRRQIFEAGGQLTDLQARAISLEIEFQQALRDSKDLSDAWANSIGETFLTFLTEGGKARDLLRELGEEIVKITLTKLAIEPFQEGLSSALQPLAESLYGGAAKETAANAAGAAATAAAQAAAAEATVAAAAAQQSITQGIAALASGQAAAAEALAQATANTAQGAAAVAEAQVAAAQAAAAAAQAQAAAAAAAASSIGGVAGGGAYKGALLHGGEMIGFARGGLVTRRTAFPIRGGIGEMAERGSEYILPAGPLPSGKMGVYASGASGGDVHVHFHGVQNIDSFRRNEGQILGKIRREVARGKKGK